MSTVVFRSPRHIRGAPERGEDDHRRRQSGPANASATARKIRHRRRMAQMPRKAAPISSRDGFCRGSWLCDSAVVKRRRLDGYKKPGVTMTALRASCAMKAFWTGCSGRRRCPRRGDGFIRRGRARGIKRSPPARPSISTVAGAAAGRPAQHTSLWPVVEAVGWTSTREPRGQRRV